MRLLELLITMYIYVRCHIHVNRCIIIKLFSCSEVVFLLIYDIA